MRKKPRPSLKEIKNASEKIFGEKIWKNKRGQRDIVRQRQSCHYIANVIFGYSLANTGKYLGRYDHASVLHGCKVIENEIDTYPKIQENIAVILLSIKKNKRLPPKERLKLLIDSNKINNDVKKELIEILEDLVVY